MPKLHTHIDATGIVWVIQKIVLPKKRGVYTCWNGDTVDGKRSIKSDTLQNTFKDIHNKFGTFNK